MTTNKLLINLKSNPVVAACNLHEATEINNNKEIFID